MPSIFAKAASAAVETTLATLPVVSAEASNGADFIRHLSSMDLGDNRKALPNVPSHLVRETLSAGYLLATRTRGSVAGNDPHLSRFVRPWIREWRI
jgi:hypothetical protein